GAAVAGAIVVAAPTDPADPDRDALRTAWYRTDGVRATTDRDGAYTLRGLAAGTWDVYVAREGLAPRLLPGVTVAAGAIPSTRDVRLDAGRSVTGRVLHADGRPAALLPVMYRVLGTPDLGTMEE